ncbi:ATP-binding cassette domain-containing protein [Rhodospirillum sp. A1_3_36]|uniref:ATP-binding cassette domain-containing protein n=1 Tax=Rhodospirillum sp. A1_3_36 TaxID=3391666 RepID=UPI0039A66E7A
MAPPPLALRDITLGFGGRPLFRGVTAEVEAGARLCLVGRNGGGKSTLLKVMAGQVEADGGEVFVQPGVTVSYLPQEPDLSGWPTLRDAVVQGLPPTQRSETHRADILLEALSMDPDREPVGLSGGEARRAALARALVGEPEILLLDEPTNHLDLPAITWLENHLAGFRGALVLISHDRAFLSRLTRATLWLDRGVVRRLDQGFSAFEAWRDETLEMEAEQERKFDKLIAEETRWSRQGISARRKRNQGRLARLYDMRKERSDRVAVQGAAKMTAEAGQTSGKLVMEAEGVSIDLGGRPILKGFSARVLRGDRLGIVGPNGAGKSTLLKIMTGALVPDSGKLRLGTNLNITYLDQSRSTLDPEKSVKDTLCDMGGDMVDVRGTPRHVHGYMRDFLFEDRQAQSPVGSLSGGERNRLLLAKALARDSNLMILDEPTNDLDMETLDLLQDVLADYEGTLLLVSHDRDFVDRVVTSTILMDGLGGATEYPGGYTDAVRQAGGAPWEIPRAKAKSKGEKSSGSSGAGLGSGSKPKAKPVAKLSYKDQRLLDQLPGTMERLQGEIALLEGALSDPALFTKDPEGYQSKAKRLEEAQQALADAEEKWLDLEMQREELSAG